MQAGDGPPLVLIHGLSGSGTWWKRNLPALSATFRVTAIDLPGFGSSHPDARLILDEAPAQVAALMGELGIERAHVMGHSMGGLVAAGLAADHPARVDRLVLVDAGFLSFDRGWWDRIDRSAANAAVDVADDPADPAARRGTLGPGTDGPGHGRAAAHGLGTQAAGHHGADARDLG